MANKIRVLHVLPWVTSGGVERRRLTLAEHLPRNRFEQRIVCKETSGPLREEVERCGVRVMPIGGKWSLGDVRSAARVAGIMRQYRPDIVHGAVFEGVLMAAVGATLARAEHLILEEIDYPIQRRMRADLLLRILGVRADRFVGVSPAVGQYLSGTVRLPKRKVRVICNGVEVPRELPAEVSVELRDKLGIPREAFVCGSVGRVHDEHKRFSDLIRAAAFAIRRVRTLYLLIVGRGRDTPALRHLAKDLGIEDRVIFSGFQHDTAPLYRSMDVFALASNRESFGLVLVEAMFAGLPVVTTAIGGPADVAVEGETAIFVPVGDVAAIAEALATLAGSPELRARLGTAGRARALQCFTAERYAKDVQCLYEDVAGAGVKPEFCSEA